MLYQSEKIARVESEKRDQSTDCATNPICQVITCINNDLIFVNSNSELYCKYRRPYKAELIFF